MRGQQPYYDACAKYLQKRSCVCGRLESPPAGQRPPPQSTPPFRHGRGAKAQSWKGGGKGRRRRREEEEEADSFPVGRGGGRRRKEDGVYENHEGEEGYLFEKMLFMLKLFVAGLHGSPVHFFHLRFFFFLLLLFLSHPEQGEKSEKPLGKAFVLRLVRRAPGPGVRPVDPGEPGGVPEGPPAGLRGQAEEVRERGGLPPLLRGEEGYHAGVGTGTKVRIFFANSLCLLLLLLLLLLAAAAAAAVAAVVPL